MPVFMLTACLDFSEQDDLQQFMTESRQKAQSKPPEVFTPAVRPQYIDPPDINPHAFSILRMRPEEAEMVDETGNRKTGLNAPNLNRPKEVLEGYDLENLRFVGTIGSSGSSLSGLVEADGHVYTVRVGNYMGKNYGRVVKITADEITLVEKFEDANNNWTDKQTKLAPQSEADAEADAAEAGPAGDPAPTRQ